MDNDILYISYIQNCLLIKCIHRYFHNKVAIAALEMWVINIVLVIYFAVIITVEKGSKNGRFNRQFSREGVTG